jgi:predicted nucleotidyltransferase
MGMAQSELESTAHPAAGIADALFNKVQQRVLGVLFGNPGRSFYTNEIIELAACGTGAVQRELARLAGASLVNVTRVGNQKHYQANMGSPVYEELRGLVVKTSGICDVLARALEPLGPQITAAFVYGSVAKGEDTATSDIDLMVVSESLTYADLFGTLEAAGQQLGRPVNPTIYTREMLSSRIREDIAFVRRVMEEPKLWVIGSEHELAS